MMRAIICVLVISLGILIKSCNTVDPPPGDKPTLTLKLEDVSCTETWIELTTTNLQLPAAITLKQTNPTDDTKSHILNLNTKDSLLYIDSLLPNKSYNFIVSHSSAIGGLSGISSNELSVTTMDTTSHNFTWQVFSFGEHSHSRLNDVAIVGDEVWAFGEIYMSDSLGQPDSQPYGIAIWAGQNWELKKIFHSTNIPVTPRGILVISPNEIYLAAGSIFRWDGVTSAVQMVFSRLSLPDPNATIEKLWGSSNAAIYGVGNAGSIVFYNGTLWSRIESGTDVDLKNIWGAPDGTVWACGYSGDYAISSLLKISGQKIEKIYEGYSSNQNNGYYIGPISGVWGIGDIRIYMMNWSGTYIQANSSNLYLEKETAKFSDVGLGIDGTDDNNIFSCGEGFVGHWNGISYTEYPELYKSSRTFLNVSVKGNTVAAVGSDYNSFIYSQAVIALSK